MDLENNAPEGTGTMTAQQLLDIPLTAPERLFAEDEGLARDQWRALASLWHPDRNPESIATAVFSHLGELRRAASEKRAKGSWQETDRLQLTAADGSRFRLRYQLSHPLDIGRLYCGKTTLCYLLDEDYTDLARIAERLVRALPFANDAMREALAPLLPQLQRRIRLRSGTALILRKAPEYVPLRQLVAFAGGKLDPRQVAWVVSSLLNLLCYLENAGLVHQAIDIDHLLVAPAEHSVALAGGWWYACRAGEPLRALPGRSMSHAPPDILARKAADPRLDQYLVRATALELLGDDATGTPAAMREYLALPPAGCAVTDYEHWQQVLWASFGERKFTPLGITAADIYGRSACSMEEPASQVKE